ncbi:hypothetical protein FRB93_004331 [Tulasnella sp. JGI-2019a]|nr:hypothetical protein FRB93_004331 [Tulasnella sp. JGI-2019a]
MLSFRGISASIRVDGKDLDHYQPEFDDETKTATCWIPSEAGRCYSIRWQQDTNMGHGASAAGRIFLDGTKDMKAGAYTSFHSNRFAECHGAPISSSTERPFMFANIILTDDHAATTSTAPLDVGSIKLTIQRVRKTGKMLPEKNRDHISGSVLVLHERSKKAGGHATQLGPIRSVQTTRTVQASEPYSHEDHHPYVTFLFRYRPAAILEASGIMPRLEPPQRILPETYNDDAAKDADERRKKAQLRAIEAERVALEEKLALNVRRTQALGHGAVKPEQAPARPFFKTGEVIDLTMEDDD